ncbi:MAG TPA: hypothetical protein DCP37_15895, partial [Dehalococcoidia bacterium]|nr:hypothetical protein [Dehalococcoidia bacterium]
YGTHPSSSTGVTEADNDFITMYAAAGRARLKGDPGPWNAFMDKYVYGCETHHDYLNLLGADVLASVRDVGGALI